MAGPGVVFNTGGGDGANFKIGFGAGADIFIVENKYSFGAAWTYNIVFGNTDINVATGRFGYTF